MRAIVHHAKSHVGACREILLLLTRYRELTLAMAARELRDRYSGQVLGILWAIAHPVFMIGIYIFLFVIVFKIKIAGVPGMPMDYTTYLLSGMIPWLAMHELLVRSSSAISSSANLVKQVVFPIEVLPVRTVLTSLLTMAVSLAVLVIYTFATHGSIPWTYALLPVLILIQVIWMTGLAYILSTMGVFLRDTKDLMQVGAMMCQYLLPIFFLPNQVPELFRPVLYINPFSYLIWCYQDLLYFGRFEHPWAWLASALFAFAFFGLGYRVFRRAKSVFGNVL